MNQNDNDGIFMTDEAIEEAAAMAKLRQRSKGWKHPDSMYQKVLRHRIDPADLCIDCEELYWFEEWDATEGLIEEGGECN